MLITPKWLANQEQSSLLLSAWQRLVDLMADLCDVPAGYIVHADPAEYKVVIANQKPENPYQAGMTVAANVNIFCRKVVETDAPLYEGAATEKACWQDNPEVTDDGFNTYLGYPVHWPDGSVFGTICVMDFNKSQYNEKYAKLLEHFRDMAEKELELCDKNLQLKTIAYTDELTRVLNRKGFFERACSQFSAQHDSNCLHIFYFDIDNLKPINDQFGHQRGDKVLTCFAEQLAAMFDNKGLVARFGGDEFVVMVQDDGSFDAAETMKALSARVQSSQVGVEILYSAGYATASSSQLDIKMLESLISIADKKMYQNKTLRPMN